MLPAPSKPRTTDEAYELAGFDRAGREPVTASVDRILAQRVSTVARAMASHVCGASASGVRVVICEREVWPSSECNRLWESYVEANQSRFDTSSGAWIVQFGHGEHEDLIALLSLIIVFGWGVVAATREGHAAFQLDHDGRVWLWRGDHALATRIANEISRAV